MPYKPRAPVAEFVVHDILRRLIGPSVVPVVFQIGRVPDYYRMRMDSWECDREREAMDKATLAERAATDAALVDAMRGEVARGLETADRLRQLGRATLRPGGS